MDPSMPLYCNKPSSQVMTDNFWKITGLSGSTRRDLAGHVGERLGSFSLLLFLFLIQQGSIYQKSPLPQTCQLNWDCQGKFAGSSTNTFYTVYPEEYYLQELHQRAIFSIFYTCTAIFTLNPPHLLLPMFVFRTDS